MLGTQAGERRPDAIVVVADATNLDNHLRFALQLRELGLPMVLALNMIDMAARDGLTIDAAALAAELGVPVVATVAVRKRGLDALRDALGETLCARAHAPADRGELDPDIRHFQREARRIARAATIADVAQPRRHRARSTASCCTRCSGPLILLGAAVRDVPGGVQLVRSADRLDRGRARAGSPTPRSRRCPTGFVRDLLVEGVINGVGSVVVFLPQIVILFLFILVLEASGYMVRAAMLMDRLMAGVGLSGRAFIPLLSSFACAIPGIMATRSISDPRERLTTILVAPLMTCSARLPVYAVIIGAFIPARRVMWGVGLAGAGAAGAVRRGHRQRDARRRW